MVQKTFHTSDNILHLPVCDTGTRRYIEIRDALNTDTVLAEFYISLGSSTPYAYYPLYLTSWNVKAVELRCMDEDAPSDLFNNVQKGGTIEERYDLYSDMYQESERQQIHFSSRRGWLNDPNGLVYVDGTYHLCYQHNPFGNRHGGVNVSWGLAVSKDGVHFREYPDVIMPQDTKTHIASGSAIVDTDNISGMGPGTILAVYTALESQMYEGRQGIGNRGQMLAYSTDGGYSFQHFPNNPIITIPEGCWWRDPKILRMDDGSLCIAVYETYEGEDCVSFYSSTDCVNWNFESRTMDLHECPDLFCLPVMETGKKLWVLYGARGMYRVGIFEDYKFQQIEKSMYLDYGSATYAGQTWNSHPDSECRYHIAWLNEDTWGKPDIDVIPFSQSMTLICKFTLHETAAGYRLFRTPIDAVDSIRSDSLGEINSFISEDKPQKWEIPIPGDVQFSLQSDHPVTIMVNEHGFTYDPVSNHLRFSSGKEYTLTSSDQLSVRIITDVRSVEFFVCGEISASYSSLAQDKDLTIQGKHVQIQGQIWKLQNIWENDK